MDRQVNRTSNITNNAKSFNGNSIGGQVTKSGDVQDYEDKVAIHSIIGMFINTKKYRRLSLHYFFL